VCGAAWHGGAGRFTCAGCGVGVAKIVGLHTLASGTRAGPAARPQRPALAAHAFLSSLNSVPFPFRFMQSKQGACLSPSVGSLPNRPPSWCRRRQAASGEQELHPSSAGPARLPAQLCLNRQQGIHVIRLLAIRVGSLGSSSCGRVRGHSGGSLQGVDERASRQGREGRWWVRGAVQAAVACRLMQQYT